jgi:hypothetical protein
VEAAVTVSVLGREAVLKVRTRLTAESDVRLTEVYEEAELAGERCACGSQVVCVSQCECSPEVRQQLVECMNLIGKVCCKDQCERLPTHAIVFTSLLEVHLFISAGL